MENVPDVLLNIQNLSNQQNTKGPSHYFFLNTPEVIQPDLFSGLDQ